MADGVDFARGLFRLADPRVTLASMASIALGTAAAARAGVIDWGELFLVVAGIALIETAKNASGELVDYDSGADLGVAPEDRSPFSGGKRVLVDGLLTRRQTTAIAAVAYAAGIAVGLLLVSRHGPAVLWIGICGVACAWLYQGVPLRLAYRGFGEAVVAVCYGPLIAAGAYYVQRGTIALDVLLLALPLGLLIAAFLLINEFPDARADAAAGKRTLVVQLGRRRASALFGLVVVAALAIAAVLPLAGLPSGVWLGLLSAPLLVSASRRLAAHCEVTREVVPAQVLTLFGFLVYAAGVVLGLVLPTAG